MLSLWDDRVHRVRKNTGEKLAGKEPVMNTYVATAAELGISRNTLWRKMKKYGLA